jgi:hypothetical protein
MLKNFDKRLARVEKALAQRSEQKDAAKCNCGDPKRIFMPRPGVDMAVQLREELDLSCPVHRKRRLNRLLWGKIIGSDGKRIPNPNMDSIVEEYERRYKSQVEDSVENHYERT